MFILIWLPLISDTHVFFSISPIEISFYISTWVKGTTVNSKCASAWLLLSYSVHVSLFLGSLEFIAQISWLGVSLPLCWHTSWHLWSDTLCSDECVYKRLHRCVCTCVSEIYNFIHNLFTKKQSVLLLISFKLSLYKHHYLTNICQCRWIPAQSFS